MGGDGRLHPERSKLGDCRHANMTFSTWAHTLLSPASIGFTTAAFPNHTTDCNND